MSNRAPIIFIFGIGIVFLVLLVLSSAMYTVNPTEQAIVTQFGKPQGEPITKAGLHFKMPFVQDIHRIPKQILEWDGQRTDMPTRDKLYISVDTFGRWRIVRPLDYYTKLRDERSALSRLEDILGSETRNAVAKHDLIELIRTDKDRTPIRDETLTEIAEATAGKLGVLPPISKGRQEIEKEIKEAALGKLKDFGIELLDVRIKRINYNPTVVAKIYERMISEREQIASKFRSEGEGGGCQNYGKQRARLERNRIRGLQAATDDSRRSRRKGNRDLRRGLRSKPTSGRVLRVPQNDGNLQESHRYGYHPASLNGERTVSVSSRRGWSVGR